MTRFRLFLFYTFMAWASIVSPAEGLKMVDAAEFGAAQRQRAEMRLDMHRNGRRQVEAPSDRAANIALVLAAAVTGLWTLALVRLVGGWLA